MANKYLKKLHTDFCGYVFSNLREMKYQANQWYYTCFMHILLALKDIPTNKSIFYNKANFYRCPESKIKIGKNCIFDSSLCHNAIGVNNRCLVSTVTKQARLSIGREVGFSGVKLCCAESITIGNDCLIGANVIITDNDFHPIDPNKRKENGFGNSCKKKAVSIGNNVFIGVNSIILKGTTIGDNSIVGAGSVVSGIIPPNVIAAGNPCKVIREL